MPNEVEIKFRVADVPTLEQRLRDAGFHVVTPRTHELNMLYDFGNGRLRKAGQLLRLRQYGQKWTLTHKARGSTGIHKTRIETETQVADGEKMHEILLALGLVPKFLYEKFRAEWTDGRGHVVVDETPIGNLAEIEGQPDWIEQIAATLGVNRKQYITQNYAQLFRDWKQHTRSRAENMTFKAVRSG
jgi:adenylate cyclase class 2